MVIEVNNKARTKINIKILKEVTEDFLKRFKQSKKEVSIAIVGDVTIRRLNKIYRGVDKITDVLAFAEDVTKENSNYLGEVIIDYAQVKRQAKGYKNKVTEELIFILIHGLLHLLGYDDKNEKGRKEMIKQGMNLMKKYK